MPVEYLAIILPCCTIPVLLVSINEFNKMAEIEKRKSNVVDFNKFVKYKKEGDEVDSDIAELIDSENLAA